MSYINKKEVETIYKTEESSKLVPGRKQKKLIDICQKSLNHYVDYLSTLDIYEMGQITNGIDHFLDDKKRSISIRDYQRGDIVLLDFGFANFGYEFSYPHPAVVLAETTYFIMIAPCSTKKYGKSYDDVIDAEESDGFTTKTGVIVDGLRWCSKTRVIAPLGETNKRVLDKIEDYLLSKITLFHQILSDNDRQIYALTEENIKLKKQNGMNSIKKEKQSSVQQ